MESSKTTGKKRLKDTDMYMLYDAGERSFFIGNAVGKPESRQLDLKNWSDEKIEHFVYVRERERSLYNILNHRKMGFKRDMDVLVNRVNSLTDESQSRYTRGWYFDMEVNRRIRELSNNRMFGSSRTLQEDPLDSRVLLQTFLRVAANLYNKMLAEHAKFWEDITELSEYVDLKTQHAMDTYIGMGNKSVRVGTAAALIVEEYIERKQEVALAFVMVKHEERRTEKQKKTEEKVMEVYFSRPRTAIGGEQHRISEKNLEKDIEKIMRENVGENAEEQAAFFWEMLLSFKEKHSEIRKQQKNLVKELDFVNSEVSKVSKDIHIDKAGVINRMLNFAKKEGVYECLERKLGSRWLLNQKHHWEPEREPKSVIHKFLEQSLGEIEGFKKTMLEIKKWRSRWDLLDDKFKKDKLGKVVKNFGKMIDHFEQAYVHIKAGFGAIAIYRRYMNPNSAQRRAVAFAMTQHKRLGKSSGVPSHIPVELMKKIHQSSLL